MERLIYCGVAAVFHCAAKAGRKMGLAGRTGVRQGMGAGGAGGGGGGGGPEGRRQRVRERGRER